MQNPFIAKFKITGAISKIGETQTFASGFVKREIVVNTNTNRPSPVALQLFKEDVTKADALKMGDEVAVEGSINGREWNGANGVRYFTDLVIKKITKSGETSEVQAQPAPAPSADGEGDDEALPF